MRQQMKAWLRDVWEDENHPAWGWAFGIMLVLIVFGGFGLAHGDEGGPPSLGERHRATGDLSSPASAGELRAGELRAGTGTAGATHDLRVRKCRRIVLTYYANSGFEPHIEFFITEHERLDMGPAWFYSLIYGAANFGLRVGASAAGGCASPMDVKHYPRVLDPQKNIAWHCREMHGFYQRGIRGRDLCEHVFYPARPHDWGRGRFRRTETTFRACINRGYEVGKLP